VTSFRFKPGSADAARLDRLAAIYGSRSAALRAGLKALEEQDSKAKEVSDERCG
jgi:Arc/MetJ-type ribon-helix-helix transcriptional regulator